MKTKETFLPPKDRAELLREHKLERNKRNADKIKVILLLDDNWTMEKIAHALFIDISTVQNYKKKYEEVGLEYLLTDNYIGASAKLSIEQENELVDHLRNKIYLSTAEVVEHVKAEYKIKFSISGMNSMLHRLNFSFKKPKIVPAQADELAQLLFVELYDDLKKSLGKNDKIYFGDAAHPQHNSNPTYGWIYKGEEKQLKSNSGRQRLNILGAIDIENFDSVFLDCSTVNMLSMVDLIEELEKKNPLSKNIYLILDNAKYAKNEFITDLTSSSSKVKIVFLPTYAPNLNLIERLWKFFKKKVTANKYYPNFNLFKTNCMKFLKNIKRHRVKLKTLLAENFQLISVA